MGNTRQLEIDQFTCYYQNLQLKKVHFCLLLTIYTFGFYRGYSQNDSVDFHNSDIKINLIGVVFLSADFFYETRLNESTSLQFGLQISPVEVGALALFDEKFSVVGFSFEPRFYFKKQQKGRPYIYVSPYLKVKNRFGLESYYEHSKSEWYLGILTGFQRPPSRKWSAKDFDAGIGVSLAGSGFGPGSIDFRLRYTFGISYTNK